MDDERLKEVRTLGTDYFDELLERIRDIRGSEKRFYQEVREIYRLVLTASIKTGDESRQTEERERVNSEISNDRLEGECGRTLA